MQARRKKKPTRICEWLIRRRSKMNWRYTRKMEANIEIFRSQFWFARSACFCGVSFSNLQRSENFSLFMYSTHESRCTSVVLFILSLTAFWTEYDWCFDFNWFISAINLSNFCFQRKETMMKLALNEIRTLFTSNDTPPVSFLIKFTQTAIATQKMWMAGTTRTSAGFWTNARDEFNEFSRRWINETSFVKTEPEIRNNILCYHLVFLAFWVRIFLDLLSRMILNISVRLTFFLFSLWNSYESCKTKSSRPRKIHSNLTRCSLPSSGNAVHLNLSNDDCLWSFPLFRPRSLACIELILIPVSFENVFIIFSYLYLVIWKHFDYLISLSVNFLANSYTKYSLRTIFRKINNDAADEPVIQKWELFLVASTL